MTQPPPPPPAQTTTFQQKGGPWPTYRPIAPSITPPKILPRPDVFDNDKRKWGSTFEESNNSNMNNKMHRRRGSGSSQGSNSSTSLAADQRMRRKEQNRAAQRAFRERKERYVKELEDRIKEIEAAHAIQVSQLEQENAQLKSAMKDMQNEMHQLKGAAVAFDMSLNKIQNLSNPSSSTTKEEKETEEEEVALKGEGEDVTTVSPPYSNSQSPAAVSAASTTSPAASTPRIPSSAVACIRDKDGVSFCQRLKEEVCSNAYDQLLTEPLFDAHGFLNETVASHPVPIVTSSMSPRTKERSRTEIFNELEQTLNANLSSIMQEAAAHQNVDLISCSVVWNKMAKHPMFDKFDLEDLCDELKKRAKCSRTGPVFEEYEVQEVLNMMKDRVRKQDQS